MHFSLEYRGWLRKKNIYYNTNIFSGASAAPLSSYNISCVGQRKNQLNSFNAACSMPIICRCLMGHRRLVYDSGEPEIIAALFILIKGMMTLGHLCTSVGCAVGRSWARLVLHRCINVIECIL